MFKSRSLVVWSLLQTCLVALYGEIAWAYPPPGGGGGGGGGTTLPAVRYSIQAITSISTPDFEGIQVRALNNSGVIVGNVSLNGIQNEPVVVVGGALFSSNTLDSLAAQYSWPVPPGFRFRICMDVNEFGVVVGSMGTDDRARNSGYALDTHNSSDPSTWTYYNLPGVGEDYSLALAINEMGDIVASYRPLNSTSRVPYLFNLYEPETEPTIIPYSGAAFLSGFNNFGQILFTNDGSNDPSVYEVGQPLMTFTDADYRAEHGDLLNDAGVFAWSAQFKKGGSIRPVRRGITGNPPLQQLSTSTDSNVVEVNQQSDVLLQHFYLYHDALGLINVHDLILSSDPLRSFWLKNYSRLCRMTDRSNNAADPTYLKFPVIVGIVDTGTSQTMVLLIPGPLPQ